MSKILKHDLNDINELDDESLLHVIARGMLAAEKCRPAKEHDQLWKLKEEVRNGASNLKVRLLGSAKHFEKK